MLPLYTNSCFTRRLSTTRFIVFKTLLRRPQGREGEVKSRKKSPIISRVLRSRKHPTPGTSAQSDSGEFGKEPSAKPMFSGEIPKFSMGLGIGATTASGFSLYPDETLDTEEDKFCGLNIMARFLITTFKNYLTQKLNRILIII